MTLYTHPPDTAMARRLNGVWSHWAHKIGHISVLIVQMSTNFQKMSHMLLWWSSDFPRWLFMVIDSCNWFSLRFLISLGKFGGTSECQIKLRIITPTFSPYIPLSLRIDPLYIRNGYKWTLVSLVSKKGPHTSLLVSQGWEEIRNSRNRRKKYTA